MKSGGYIPRHFTSLYVHPPLFTSPSGDSCISHVLIGSRNLEYPWIFTVLRIERKMVRRFTKVSEEEIEEAFFYPSDWVNTKTTIPLRVGEEL